MKRLIRSALFVPANNPRAIEKAAQLGADMLVLDLEDAVGPDDKEGARDLVSGTLEHWQSSGALRAVRVNAADTPWGAGDLRAASQADAVILPKVEQVGDLHAARSSLNAFGSSVPLWAMIETPRGVLNVAAIAGATGTGLGGLMAGVNDLARLLRCAPDHDRAAMLPHLAQILCAARANGLYALDGVYNQFRDHEGFRREASQGRMLGFDGKTLIHPDQVEPAHRCFQPSPAELERAAQIVAAFTDPANAGKGVINLDGDMVERLHLDAARALLSAGSGNDP
ncbi:HpcH/HpaI aldolase/citrate lyase family protein [Maricaulis sp.]|uniref:HpcH/HpaI aldolase/citrate lyase family protein n=1 Tax=Maricaulis sp. TaxID=1486257 RepID=UPI003A9457F9